MPNRKAHKAINSTPVTYDKPKNNYRGLLLFNIIAAIIETPAVVAYQHASPYFPYIWSAVFLPGIVAGNVILLPECADKIVQAFYSEKSQQLLTYPQKLFDKAKCCLSP